MGILKSYKVSFLGRTGNGKTTLINALYGTLFSTDPLVSCTKELYTVSIMDNTSDKFDSITIYDTPGIGEFSSNERYQKFYQEAVSESDCLVLVSTFDKTDAPAQRLLLSLKPFFKENMKFVIALNHIDSTIVAADTEYSPWNEDVNEPTDKCLKHINERIGILKDRFGGIYHISTIVPVCGARNYGMANLKKVIHQ